MTHRRGKEASEKKSGIGEDKRQPVMARQAARWRRSNLVILVMLKETIRVKREEKSFIQK